MERILAYPEAIREALEQEMEKDPAVFVMGLGVDDPKRILGTTAGLLEKFGPARVFDTPLAEDGMTGVAVGAALAGLRPVHVHIRMDFVLLAMNQIVNMAAKSCHMYAGALPVPIVIRSIIGKSWGQGAQHSQSIYPLLMNIPGLKITAPSTPYDAKGCLIQSIRDDNPVIFIEHRMLYYQKGHVPADPYTVPFGKARLLSRGADITLVGISQMAVECLRAQRCLLDAGIHAEVIDPVSLSPLDLDTIRSSAMRTGHLIVVDNAWMSCGAGAEIIARLVEDGCHRNLKVRRMGFASVPCPTSPPLEREFYPDAGKIAVAAFEMLNPKRKWEPESTLPPEEVAFKGPF
ncbi:MAG: transketolase C-terminal domain-containing protein [Syntrophales bacterium]|nr:transketolase C-terminal domain-containing protein [Syntrophales bacterium]